MLIPSSGTLLTVRRISKHLGVREWSIARELKKGKEGETGRLRGEKVAGPGRVGQGGQWQVELDDYLDWLRVPTVDREYLGAYGLPALHPFAAVARNEGITAAQLQEFVEVNDLDHIKILKNYYLTHLQRIAVERLHRAVAPVR